MKVRILGSGTSTGVPQIGCTCPVCTSADPKDNRLRASAIVETEDARILIDCGPDFRAQVLHLPFEKIDVCSLRTNIMITWADWMICVRSAVSGRFLSMPKNMWHAHCVCGCLIVLSITVIPVFLIFPCRKLRSGTPFPSTIRKWCLCG